MQDVAEGKKKNCKFLKKMSTLCLNSYVLKGDKVTPCMLHPKNQKCIDSKQPETCDLQQVCGGSGRNLREEEEEEVQEEEENDETAVELVEKRKRKGFLRTAMPTVVPTAVPMTAPTPVPTPI